MLLVTGATGHSGRYFLQELINHKYVGKIRCVVRNSSDTTLMDGSGLNIDKVVGDLNDREFTDRCTKGVDMVMHIASIRYSLNIIESAIRNNVPRAICVHTTGIYSKFKDASEEYKIIKNKLHEMAEASEIKITTLNPTMIYGDVCDHNMSKFIKMIDRFRIFPVINHGKGLIQPVNARDLAKAYYDVMMMPFEKSKCEYILSGEKPITMLEAFGIISNELGKKTLFVSFPLVFGVLLARFLKAVTLGKVDYVERVERMSEDRCFSYEDANNDFGYSPEAFKIGIAREVKEYLRR